MESVAENKKTNILLPYFKQAHQTPEVRWPISSEAADPFRRYPRSAVVVAALLLCVKGNSTRAEQEKQIRVLHAATQGLTSSDWVSGFEFSFLCSNGTLGVAYKAVYKRIGDPTDTDLTGHEITTLLSFEDFKLKDLWSMAIAITEIFTSRNGMAFRRPELANWHFQHVPVNPILHADVYETLLDHIVATIVAGGTVSLSRSALKLLPRSSFTKTEFWLMPSRPRFASTTLQLLLKFQNEVAHAESGFDFLSGHTPVLGTITRYLNEAGVDFVEEDMIDEMPALTINQSARDFSRGISHIGVVHTL